MATLASQPLLALAALSVLILACSPLPVRVHVPAHKLADVLGQNLTCPVEVKFDINSDRIPRLIKTISCNNTVPSGYRQNCVNLYDSVLVFNKTTGISSVVDVRVGCVHWSRVSHVPQKLASKIRQED